MALKIKGIDISRAQEKFDFDAAIKAGVKYVIIRAGRSHCRHIHTRRNSCRNVGCDVVLHRK